MRVVVVVVVAAAIQSLQGHKVTTIVAVLMDGLIILIIHNSFIHLIIPTPLTRHRRLLDHAPRCVLLI